MYSDAAQGFAETLQLSEMNVDGAEHEFTTRFVPLTNIGFVQGVGSQRLGLEMRREIVSGATLRYGVVANRVDENGDYEVVNPINVRAYVKLSQGFFRRWGRTYNLADLNIAELRRSQDEIRVERSRQDLIWQTVSRYYDVVLAEKLVVNAEKALERSQENFESASARQEAGLVSKVDVYRAEIALLNSRNSLTLKRRELEKNSNLLRELLRMDDDESCEVSNEVTLLTPSLPESWEKDILAVRLDWQVSSIGSKINRIQVEKARRNLLPDVGLSVTMEQKGEGDDFSEAGQLDQTNWSVQLELLSDLDAFQEESALRKVEIERTQMRRAQAALKRQIFREVEEAFADMLVEEQTLKICQQKSSQAVLALELAKTRYDKGLSDNLDVIDAEVAYADSLFDIARAIKSCNLASVSLAFKLGVLNRDWLQDAVENAHGGDSSPHLSVINNRN